MFENTFVKGQPRRSGLFLLITGLAYAALVTALGVWMVLGFSPGLAESIDWARLAPPVPVVAMPPQAHRRIPDRVPKPNRSFTAPKRVTNIPRPEDVPSLPKAQPVIGLPTTGDPNTKDGVPIGIPGPPNPAGPPPTTPPPPPPVRPTPEPTAKPKPPEKIQVSGGVLQGGALTKVQPAYPPIAKAARASGAVQVFVTISEEGRVIEASVQSGHPLLREAALQAARQWRFKPTELTGVPVKVQGVLTFNFTLQ
jgi:protein TonB